MIFRKPGDASAFANFKKITEAYMEIIQGTKEQVKGQFHAVHLTNNDM